MDTLYVHFIHSPKQNARKKKRKKKKHRTHGNVKMFAVWLVFLLLLCRTAKMNYHTIHGVMYIEDDRYSRSWNAHIYHTPIHTARQKTPAANYNSFANPFSC